MFRFNISDHDLIDVAGAVLLVIARLRERCGDDAVLLDRAKSLEDATAAVMAACEGLDTRPATLVVVAADGRRDDAIRVVDRVLQVHMMSPLHAATATAARELWELLAGDGFDFLTGPYSAESARINQILDRLEARPDAIAAVGLAPYLAEVRAAEAAFVAAREARGQLAEERPALVASVRAPLSRALRSTFLLLLEPARARNAGYILEPLAALRKKPRPAAPAAPTPTV